MSRDARPVEAEQHCLGQDTSDRHVHDVGRAPVEITKCCDVVDGGGRLEERTGQVPGGGFLLFQRSWLCERSCRSAEANDPDQVLETAASGPLLCTTDDERLEAYAPADDERSYAGRPPNL